MNNDRRVFDVMRPGTVPANPTSRPVITTTHHRPTIPDDQFVPEHGINEDHKLDKTKRITITPADKPDEDPLKSLQAWADNTDKETPDHKVGTAEKPETTFQPEAFSLEEANDNASGVTPEPSDPPEKTEDIALPLDDPAKPTETIAAPEDSAQTEPAETSDEVMTPTNTLETPKEPDTELPAAIPPTEDSETPALAPEATEPVPGASITGNTAVSAEPPAQLVVSHHKKPASKLFWVTMIIFALLFSLAAVNFLLDASILPGDNIPHTNFI